MLVIRHGIADIGVILVTISTNGNKPLAIDEHPTIGVETNVANAQACRLMIDQFVLIKDRSAKRIEIGMMGMPEMRFGYIQNLAH